jgi:hypothetical protein
MIMRERLLSLKFVSHRGAPLHDVPDARALATFDLLVPPAI